MTPSAADSTADPRPLRVLLDARMATWTGVGRYTVGLARALARREDVDLTCVAGPDGAEVLAGLPQLTASGSPFSISGMRELSAIARAQAPDVTHCPHFPTPLPSVHPLVVTMHDLTPLVIAGVMPSAARRMVYRVMVGRAVKVADTVVTLSQFSADEVAKRFPGVLDKTLVTGAGADDFTAGEPESLAADLARFCAEGPYVLSMGSTRPHKDLPTLLAAFVQLASSHPDLRLVLAGAGEPGYLERELAEAPAGVRARVRFAGRVTDGELRTLFRSAAVFAFPSHYEGFGLPPLEAMGLGAPVVVARSASLPEVVGDAALAFEPGDAAELAARIGTVLEGSATRDRLVAAGYARAAELTWDAAAGRTVEAYRRAVAKGGALR